ncbi:MAG: HepT-like ribonuclease domain-containing protein [Nonlabens sp.]
MSKDLHKIESAVLSIKRIKRYTADMDYNSFANNDVVLMHFINLGEKIGSISEGFRNEYPDIAYRKAKDMRNYIAHQYEGVDITNVWLTVTNIIPDLEKQLKQILDDQ